MDTTRSCFLRACFCIKGEKESGHVHSCPAAVPSLVLRRSYRLPMFFRPSGAHPTKRCSKEKNLAIMTTMMRVLPLAVFKIGAGAGALLHGHQKRLEHSPPSEEAASKLASWQEKEKRAASAPLLSQTSCCCWMVMSKRREAPTHQSEHPPSSSGLRAAAPLSCCCPHTPPREALAWHSLVVGGAGLLNKNDGDCCSLLKVFADSCWSSPLPLAGSW